MIFVVIDFVIDLFFFKDRTNKDLEKVQSAFIKQLCTSEYVGIKCADVY